MADLVVWQRVEGAGVFAAALAVAFAVGGVPVWLALLAFFAPDLSFAAYLLGPRAGAFVYNLVHVYAFGTVVIALGLITDIPTALGLGALWLAHSGFDRMLGYGLKSTRGFKFTHLGRIDGS